MADDIISIEKLYADKFAMQRRQHSRRAANQDNTDTPCPEPEGKRMFIIPDDCRSGLEDKLSDNPFDNALFLNVRAYQLPKTLQELQYPDKTRFASAFPTAPPEMPPALPNAPEYEPLFKYRLERASLNYQLLISNMILLTSDASTGVMLVAGKYLEDARDLAEIQHGLHWVKVMGHCKRDLRQQYIHRIQHTLWARIASIIPSNDLLRNSQEQALSSDSAYFENSRYRYFVDACKEQTGYHLKQIKQGNLHPHEPTILKKKDAPAKRRHLRLV